MSEMVERVARAICESEKMNPDDALGGWIHWQDAARAAIEAMREPTEAMLLVRCDPLLRLGDEATPRVMQWRNGFWHGMIDEALK